MEQRTGWFLVIILIIAGGCKYHKGDIYTSLQTGDSLLYVVAAKGSGEKVSDKAHQLILKNEYKGNACSLIFLSDSLKLKEGKGLLLFNSSLPDIKKDMLTKGFFGTFTSRQKMTYMLVSYEDFDRFFAKKEK